MAESSESESPLTSGATAARLKQEEPEEDSWPLVATGDDGKSSRTSKQTEKEDGENQIAGLQAGGGHIDSGAGLERPHHMSRRITGSVYVSAANEVSVAFYINDKETPASESLVLEIMKKRMASATPPKHWVKCLNQFTAKYGDTIETRIECFGNSELTFIPTEPFSFKIDEHFYDVVFVEHCGIVSGDLKQRQRIKLICTVHKVSGEDREMTNKCMFTCDWMPKGLEKVTELENRPKDDTEASDNERQWRSRHKNPGGMAISKSIRKVIGLDNKQLDVGGCSVIFPPESFTKSTPVNVRAEINSSKLPKNFTAYTPILYVDAAGLKGKVRVKLPSWRVNNQPEKAEARILHIPKGSTEWEDTNVTLPVTDEPYFEFEWQDFSPITVGVWFDSNTSVGIVGSVYVSNANEVSIAYHIDDKATPTSESLASEAVENRMGSATPPKNFKMRLKQFTVKPGDTIETQVSCEDPRELMFKPEDPFTFTVDKNFAEGLFLEHHGVVTGNLEETQLIEMQCMVFKKSGQERQKVGNSAMFTCDWMPRKRRVIEQTQEKEAAAPLMRDVTFHLQGPKTDSSQHHVMAKNYANQEAKIQFSESETSTTVTRNLMKHDERLEDETKLPYSKKSWLKEPIKVADDLSTSPFIGTTSLENKTTSMEDSATQTSTSVEMAGTQTDEVVTTFENLNDGVAISKSIRKMIGLEGEQLNVGGCSAAFPSDSFSESTPVNVKAELNTSKRSKKFILFTPSLYVDAKGLHAKVRVRLPSWYINKRQQRVEARILHLPKNADDWEDTGMTLPVTNLPFFEFDWQDFSGVAIGDDKDSSNLQELSRRIAGNVYVSDANEVCIVFHINDKETPTSESMASEVVKERMASAKPPKHWKIHLRQFTAKYNDDIEAHIECDVPSDLTFKPKEPLMLRVDENFDEEPFVEHNGVVSGALEEEQLIEMRCTVNIISENNKKRKIGSPSFFTCNWMPRKMAAKQNQVRKSSRGDGKTIINVRNRIKRRRHDGSTIAQNLVGRGAKYWSTQTGTRSQMNVGKFSPAKMEQSEESNQDSQSAAGGTTYDEDKMNFVDQLKSEVFPALPTEKVVALVEELRESHGIYSAIDLPFMEWKDLTFKAIHGAQLNRFRKYVQQVQGQQDSQPPEPSGSGVPTRTSTRTKTRTSSNQN